MKKLVFLFLTAFLAISLSSCGDDDSSSSSCEDGIINGTETGVDCGGDCAPCPTCSDGMMNGQEEGVDCGGPTCIACPTCEDGIMNGQEEGEDCGGDCDDCATVLGIWDTIVFTVNGGDALEPFGILNQYYNFSTDGQLEVVGNSVASEQTKTNDQYTIEYDYLGVGYATGFIVINSASQEPISGTFTIQQSNIFKITGSLSNGTQVFLELRLLTTDLCAGIVCPTGTCSYGVCI